MKCRKKGRIQKRLGIWSKVHFIMVIADCDKIGILLLLLFSFCLNLSTHKSFIFWVVEQNELKNFQNMVKYDHIPNVITFNLYVWGVKHWADYRQKSFQKQFCFRLEGPRNGSHFDISTHRTLSLYYICVWET